MATSAALHSDHVNYLILRYLQEHGHESTALAFHKDWHRPSEFQNPESLPFAQVVQRDTLISVIQDGLVYDELASRRAKGQGQRRWRWAGVNPREQLSEEAAAGLREDGALAPPPRPASSGKRKSKPPARMTERDVGKGQPEGFPIPPAKRQRRSEGPEANGERDAMELDDVSPSAAEADEDAEAASPTVSAEVDVVEVPERYDSMDVATQTEVKTGPKTTTMYWKIDKPGATVLHSIWNPAKDDRYAHSLLTVGEGLCRFYDIPTSMDNPPEISHLDDPNMPEDGTVTASAWHPDGHTAACAVDTYGQEHGGKQALQLILNHSRVHASTVWAAEDSGMTPAGVVLCMRYSPSGSRLLVVRTNLLHSLVQVWHTTPRLDDDSPSDALFAWQRLDRQVLDACWTGEDSFLVSGKGGLSSAYHVSTFAALPETFDEGYVKQRGVVEGSADMVGLREPYDKVRFDAQLGVVVFASSSKKLLLTTPLLEGNTGNSSAEQAEVGGRLDIADELTALAFQPGQRSTESSRLPESNGNEQGTLLAAAFEQGSCTLYRVSRPEERRTTCEKITTLELPDGPALALAWSPQGTHLAFGGADLVQIYATETILKRTNGSRHEALVTWRPDPTAVGKFNGEQEMEDGEDETTSGPSLSWSADGESLGFAHERQLAVIRFRPPLHSTETTRAQPETNGAASP